MNPSTAEILEVVEALGSEQVILLPNNDNIRPVAMQVGELATKTVRVVPTGSIVEGFAALLEYDPEAGADDNAAAMAASAGGWCRRGDPGRARRLRPRPARSRPATGSGLSRGRVVSVVGLGRRGRLRPAGPTAAPTTTSW